MAEVLKICHDRILPQDMFRPQRSLPGAPHRPGVRRAVIEFRKLWINGSTLRVRFLEGTAQQPSHGQRGGSVVGRACQPQVRVHRCTGRRDFA